MPQPRFMFTQDHGQESAAYNLYTQRVRLVQGIKYIRKIVKRQKKQKCMKRTEVFVNYAQV